MNILRSVVRRGFTVAQAGYFTVTSSNRWFSARQFPDRYPELSRRDISASTDSNTTPGQNTPAFSGPEPLPPQFELIGPRADNHPLLRFAFVVLAAVALTLVGLWASGDTPSLRPWPR